MSKLEHQDPINKVISRIEKLNTDPQSKSGYTEKEIVGGVLRDIDSPTLVVEGDDDVKIYGWIIDQYFNSRIKLVPAGTRSELEAIYKKVTANRDDFPLVPIVFIADRDLDLFSNCPPSYPDIIWTKGYCIENDLYLAGESLLKREFLRKSEKRLFNDVLHTVIEWFAFEIEEHKSGKPTRLKVKLGKIIPPGPDSPPTQTKMSPDFRHKRKFRHPQEENYKKIRNNHRRLLKGKYIFAALVRYLNYAGRVPQYNRFQLYDRICSNPVSEKWRDELVREIGRAINKEKKTISTLVAKKGPAAGKIESTPKN